MLVVVALGAAVVLLDPAVDAWAASSRPYGLVVASLRSLFMPLGKADLQITLVLALGAAGLRRRATASLLALLIAGLAVAVVKPAVGRIRPNGKGGSFPSGDVSSVAAVATPLVASAPALWPVAATVVGGVATFRVLDRQHHLADVAAGVLFGIAAGLIGMAAVRRLARVASYRWFLLGTAMGLAVTVHHLLFGWSERFLTALVVFLPPVLLVVAARWSVAHWRHWSAISLEGREQGDASGRRRAWLAASGSVLLGLVLVGGWFATVPELRCLWLGLACTIAAATAIGCRLERRGRRRMVLVSLGLAVLIVVLQLFTLLATVKGIRREALVRLEIRVCTGSVLLGPADKDSVRGHSRTRIASAAA